MRVAWRAAAMTGLEPDHLLVQRSSLRVSQLGRAPGSRVEVSCLDSQ